MYLDDLTVEGYFFGIEAVVEANGRNAELGKFYRFNTVHS